MTRASPRHLETVWTAYDYSGRLQGERNCPPCKASYGDPAGNEFGRCYPDSKIQHVLDTSSQDGANPDGLFVGGGSAAGLTSGVDRDHAVSVEDAADHIADAAETVAVEIVSVADEVAVVDGADDS